MFRTYRLVFVLAGIGLLSFAAWASAQFYAVQPVNPPITLSGADIGFRVEGRQGSAVTGRLMVRIDGEWVEARSNPMPTRRTDSH